MIINIKIGANNSLVNNMNAVSDMLDFTEFKSNVKPNDNMISGMVA